MKIKKLLYLVKIFFIIFIFSYLVNLLWEVAHSMLYDWNQFPLKNDIYFYIPKILTATFGDALMISIIFLINCFSRKNLKWICSPGKKDYFVLISFGLIFSVFIEIRAIFLNLWSYNGYMPLIFGIGLSPLVQLAITSIIVLFLTSKSVCKKL